MEQKAALPVDKAYEYIKTRIMDGRFHPSQKLIENDLAQSIGASRNTIKKALLKLEQENLVILEPNKGAKIKAFELQEIKNYLEIREVLEGAILRRTAKTISTSDIKALEDLIEQMKEFAASNNLNGYSQCNQQFHEIIYRASENQEAVALVKQIKTQLQRLQLRTNLVPGRIEQSIREHQQIFAALKANDGSAAQKAVVAHITHLIETIDANYQQLI